MPRANLPDSQPPRSGLQGMMPIPSFRHTGTSSDSVSRSSRLYSAPRSGEISKLNKSLTGCERILNDEFADAPEASLYMIGTIDEAEKYEV